VNPMADATAVSRGLGRRRWLILGVIGLAQLMVVLDLTVMNIALPSAQRALDFTTADRQRVVTAYTLASGSLLLLRRQPSRSKPKLDIPGVLLVSAAGRWPGRARRPPSPPRRQRDRPRQAPPFRHDADPDRQGIRRTQC
jgi:hypothetical protein